MMPGSVHAVRWKKIVVAMTERKKKMGRAGVALFQTSLRMKTEKRTTTTSMQSHQQRLGPQSEVGPVMHLPNRNWLRPGQTSYSFLIGLGAYQSKESIIKSPSFRINTLITTIIAQRIR